MKQNNIPGSISALTAVKIFDFNMYFGVLKILDDNNEYTYSLGGQTMFLKGQTMFLRGQTTFQGGQTTFQGGQTMFLGGKTRISTLAASALKSSLKPATRLQLDWTKTAKDQTRSLGLSVLRLEDHEKTGCGGPALLVKGDVLYPSNDPSKRT